MSLKSGFFAIIGEIRRSIYHGSSLAVTMINHNALST